jgi:hypothetical protein
VLEALPAMFLPRRKGRSPSLLATGRDCLQRKRAGGYFRRPIPNIMQMDWIGRNSLVVTLRVAYGSPERTFSGFLTHIGFTRIETNHENTSHQHGPSFSIVAQCCSAKYGACFQGKRASFPGYGWPTVKLAKSGLFAQCFRLNVMRSQLSLKW